MLRLLIVSLFVFITASPVNAGIDCDGSDDSVDTTYTPSSSSKAFAFIARYDDVNDSSYDVIGVHDNNNHRLYLGLDDDSSSGVFVGYGNDFKDGGGLGWSDGEVHCMALRDDSGTVRIYIDGSEHTTFSATFSGTSSDEVDLCQRPFNDGASTLPFDGKVFDVAIWESDPGAHGIAQYCNSQTKYVAEQLNAVAYWPMDDGADSASADGATVRDIVGGNDGTGDNGANNTGLTWHAERHLSYP